MKNDGLYELVFSLGPFLQLKELQEDRRSEISSLNIPGSSLLVQVNITFPGSDTFQTITTYATIDARC